MRQSKTTLQDSYRAMARPIVRHYWNDVEVDAGIIEAGIPSLFFLRESGTHAVRLLPADLLPAAGETVPYLFGRADRAHIVQQTDIIDAPDCAGFSDAALVVYFDGRRLRKIDHARASDTAREYRERLLSQFRRDRVAA